MLGVLSGIRRPFATNLGNYRRRVLTKYRDQSLARTRDPRSDRADRHIKRGGSLVVRQLTPHDEQQRITIRSRQPAHCTNKLGRQARILVPNISGCDLRQALERPQTTTLDTAMIRDHMVRDTQQPRQCAAVITAAGRTRAESPHEHLSSDVLTVDRTDASHDISQNTATMTIVKPSKRRRLLDRLPHQLKIAGCSAHILYVGIRLQKVRDPEQQKPGNHYR